MHKEKMADVISGYLWLEGIWGGDLIFFEIFCVFPSPCLTDNQEKDI